MQTGQDKHTPKERAKVVQNITLYGMVMDIILSVLKLLAGFIFISPGLIADGIHSFSDMLTDIFVLIINKFSHEAPDESHPYGHARIETLGTALLGGMLLIVALGMAFQFGQQLLQQQATAQPSLWALLIVLLSLVGKEWQFRFTMAAAKKVNSPLLEANAWHSRTDAFSSLVVLIGVSATLLGYPLAETVAAIFVALLIGKMGFELSWDALQQLIDRGITPEQHKNFIQTLKQTAGVVDVHMLRGRLMSHEIFIDLHIQVAATISVSEGHQIGEWAMANLRQCNSDVKDITLHIDYEEDDDQCSLALAPLRPSIENVLEGFSSLKNYLKLTLHYHNQLVDLELLFDSVDAKRQDEMTLMKQQFSWLDQVHCYYSEAAFNDH